MMVVSVDDAELAVCIVGTLCCFVGLIGGFMLGHLSKH
jgi:hypothetical protein